jgi:hypothetical protein
MQIYSQTTMELNLKSVMESIWEKYLNYLEIKQVLNHFWVKEEIIRQIRKYC